MATGDVTVNNTALDVRSCAKFDGVDDYINNINIGGSYISFSLSLWFKNKLNAIDALFGTQNTGANNTYFRVRSGQTVDFNLIGLVDGYQASTQTFTLNEWTHVVFTYDGATKKIYLNNNTPDSESTTGTALIPDMQIGSVATGQNFPGYMRDVRFYNVALTAAEVSKLYNNENVTRGIIGNWKLNGDATDSVGSKDGTVTGAIFVDDEQNVADILRDVRVSGNDKYLMSEVNTNNVMITHIEEAP